MKVLIIKNTESEGPGTIEDHLRSAGIPWHVTDFNRGEQAPEIDGFSHLVVMGGPMAVYEMNIHPFLRREAALIERAVKSGKHVLGVCLGSQMIAHVLGAKVYPGVQKEIGWYEVAITGDGMKDPLIAGLALDGKKSALVFQWHGDTFDLPRGTVRLASSDLYPNQAFRFSDRVYALQFHIEVTPAILGEWFKDSPDAKRIAAETEHVFSAYHERAKNFYRKFFSTTGG